MHLIEAYEFLDLKLVQGYKPPTPVPWIATISIAISGKDISRQIALGDVLIDFSKETGLSAKESMDLFGEALTKELKGAWLGRLLVLPLVNMMADNFKWAALRRDISTIKDDVHMLPTTHARIMDIYKVRNK